MTTIAHCIDDEMRRRRNDDEMIGTAQPAGWIRRCRHDSSRRIGVGIMGSQGGASGGRVGGELRVLLMVELGSPGFFRQCDVRACTHDNSSNKYGTPTM